MHELPAQPTCLLSPCSMGVSLEPLLNPPIVDVCHICPPTRIPRQTTQPRRHTPSRLPQPTTTMPLAFSQVCEPLFPRLNASRSHLLQRPHQHPHTSIARGMTTNHGRGDAKDPGNQVRLVCRLLVCLSVPPITCQTSACPPCCQIWFFSS